MDMTWWSLGRLGLVYDIAGVVALAWGFLIIGPREFAAANLFYRERTNVLSLAFGKFDAWFGVTLIVIGFLGQLLGSDTTIDNAFQSLGIVAPSVALVALTIAVVLFVFYRARFASKTMERISGLES